MDSTEVEFALNKIVKNSARRDWNVLPCDYSHAMTKNSKYPKLFIFNTDPSFLPGKHFIGVYVMNKQNWEIFDPLAVPIEQWGACFHDIKLKNPLQNTHRVQSSRSKECGKFCLFYAWHKCRGKSMNEILS